MSRNCFEDEDEEDRCFAPSPSPVSSEHQDSQQFCSESDFLKEPSSSSSLKLLCPDFEDLINRVPSTSSATASVLSRTASPSSSKSGLTRTGSPSQWNCDRDQKPSIQLSFFQTALIHDASKRHSGFVPLPEYKKPPNLLPPCPDNIQMNNGFGEALDIDCANEDSGAEGTTHLLMAHIRTPQDVAVHGQQ